MYHLTVRPTFGSTPGEALAPVYFGKKGKLREAWHADLEESVAGLNESLPRRQKITLNFDFSDDGTVLGPKAEDTSVDELMNQLVQQHAALFPEFAASIARIEE